MSLEHFWRPSVFASSAKGRARLLRESATWQPNRIFKQITEEIGKQPTKEDIRKLVSTDDINKLIAAVLKRRNDLSHDDSNEVSRGTFVKANRFFLPSRRLTRKGKLARCTISIESVLARRLDALAIMSNKFCSVPSWQL
jgi:hypothetical protein